MCRRTVLQWDWVVGTGQPPAGTHSWTRPLDWGHQPIPVTNVIPSARWRFHPATTFVWWHHSVSFIRSEAPPDGKAYDKWQHKTRLAKRIVTYVTSTNLCLAELPPWSGVPSWEATRFSAGQEILRIFMETEGSLPNSQVPATCPVSAFQSHLLKICYNIILPSTPGSS